MYNSMLMVKFFRDSVSDRGGSNSYYERNLAQSSIAINRRLDGFLRAKTSLIICIWLVFHLGRVGIRTISNVIRIEQRDIKYQNIKFTMIWSNCLKPNKRGEAKFYEG